MTRILATILAGAVVGSLATWAALRELGMLDLKPTSQAVSQPSPGYGGGAGGADSGEIEVAALARLEPENGVVSINGTPGDRLQELKVQLGQQVAKGEDLAVLESHTLRQGELELAETQLREARGRKTAEEQYADAMQAEAELAEEQAKLQELDAAAQQQKIAALQAARSAARQDLERLEAIHSTDGEVPGARIVSDQQLAHQRLAAEKAAN